MTKRTSHWTGSLLVTLSQGLTHFQSHQESPGKSERQDLMGPPWLPGTTLFQDTRYNGDPLIPYSHWSLHLSLSSSLSLIYTTFFFFFCDLLSSFSFFSFGMLFPRNTSTRWLMSYYLNAWYEKVVFSTLFPNYENLWYYNSPLSMGSMFHDPQGMSETMNGNKPYLYYAFSYDKVWFIN